MNAIADRERETYRAAWALDAYAAHSPGERSVNAFLEMSAAQPPQTVLDAGCGSGKGALALQAHGFAVDLCDLTRDGLLPAARVLPFTSACLWSVGDLGRRDWVYCCDVLEHIPTAFTMLVVANLLRMANRGVFFSISLVPDDFGKWVGKPLHQTVQAFTWWRDALRELGTLVECRDLLTTGLYLVRPR